MKLLQFLRGNQELRCTLSLPVRNERGESRREGQSKKKSILSPTLSSLLRREERETSPDTSAIQGAQDATIRGVLSMNQELRLRCTLSLSPREERAGREPERGAIQKVIPPLPNPLLPPASGREGDKFGCIRGSGTQGARKVRRILSWTAALLVAGALLTGCGQKDGHQHDYDHDHGHGHEHDHDQKPSSGASFKAGEGVTLIDETRKVLGVEVAEVSQRKLPNQVRFTVQVFGEKHHHALNQSDHSGCDVHGSGFVSTNTAAVVKAGQPVQIQKGPNHMLGGVVLGVQKALALGESEIIIGVSNATALLQPGEFIPAGINLPRDEAVTTLPQAALLRTAESTFVYAVNGNAFLRKAVKTGAEAEGWVEITSGLQPGEQVVTRPVQTLWLIELRETKGGGHSH
jgi:hypothetical protein